MFNDLSSATQVQQDATCSLQRVGIMLIILDLENHDASQHASHVVIYSLQSNQIAPFKPLVHK